MNQLFWHLLAGTRGGSNRLRILDEILQEPLNAQQLADRLGVDYRTVRHHIGVLSANGLLSRREGDGYGARLYASGLVVSNLGTLEEIHAHMRKGGGRVGVPPRRRPHTAGVD
ncbi:MAG TPA: winged helix-turn-helix domain-containing protein [Candidatus Thermoplasmatota archaeon]|nr:winged helix-turn-helix domain-containing protein [Candidatus Thermoplasmatota archaeon]